MSSNNVADFGIYAMTVPSSGPKLVSTSLDFSQNTEDTIDLTNQMMSRTIDYVQGGYFDNWLGDEEIEILVAVTGQRIHIPAKTSLYIPILASNPCVLTASVAARSVRVPVFLYNVPVPPFAVTNPN